MVGQGSRNCDSQTAHLILQPNNPSTINAQLPKYQSHKQLQLPVYNYYFSNYTILLTLLITGGLIKSIEEQKYRTICDSFDLSSKNLL